MKGGTPTPQLFDFSPPAKLWRPDREETREGLHTYTVGMYSHGKALVVYDMSMQVFPTALDLKESS